MKITQARFSIGQIVHHKIHDYRGVIVDVDPIFQANQPTSSGKFKNLPDQNKPWYYLLVDHSSLRTYVPETNLELDESSIPIDHPDISMYFSSFDHGIYQHKLTQ